MYRYFLKEYNHIFRCTRHKWDRAPKEYHTQTCSVLVTTTSFSKIVADADMTFFLIVNSHVQQFFKRKYLYTLLGSILKYAVVTLSLSYKNRLKQDCQLAICKLWNRSSYNGTQNRVDAKQITKCIFYKVNNLPTYRKS